MTRRDAIQRLLLTLLAIVFGPKVWELVDLDEVERVAGRIDRGEGPIEFVVGEHWWFETGLRVEADQGALTVTKVDRDQGVITLS